MRHPTFSIAEMMAVVAIVALDCLAVRAASTPPSVPFLLCGGLPMQVVLLVGLLIVVRRRRRMEPPPSFLLGFEVVGWIANLTYAVICFRAVRSIDMHLGNALSPLLRATRFTPFSPADLVVRIGLGVCYLTAPQLASALAAGWVTQRLSS